MLQGLPRTAISRDGVYFWSQECGYEGEDDLAGIKVFLQNRGTDILKLGNDYYFVSYAE